MRSAAGFILYHQDGPGYRYLLLRNRRHGSWGFPKGHLEEGESPLEGAMRELQEETGIENPRIVSGFETLLEYQVPKGARGTESPSYPKRVHLYLAEAIDATLKLSEEHDDGRWMSASEVLEHLQYEDLKRAFRSALSTLEDNHL